MIQNEGLDELAIVQDAITPPRSASDVIRGLLALVGITALTTGTRPSALLDTLGAVLTTLQDSPLTMTFSADDPRTPSDVVESVMAKVNDARKVSHDMDAPIDLTSGEAMILLTYAAPVITGAPLEAVDKDGNRVF